MVTNQQLLSELLAFQNLAYLKTVISTYIQTKVTGFGVDMFSLDELKLYPLTIDASTYTAIVDADLVGILYFNNLKTLNLGTPILPLTRRFIDLTRFLNVEIVKSGSFPFKGDFSGFTKVKTFSVVMADADVPAVTAPIILANNPNLEVFFISASAAFNWEEIGNLSGLTKLIEYTLANASAIPQATINNILSTARAAKTAGAPLTKIALSGCKAPTGGSSNADYLALVAAGVTVTLGTL